MSSARSAVTLMDWRRRVFALYAAVRSAPVPADGHRLWQAGRDELMRSHPQSPLAASRRASFSGLPVAPYDPALRFQCPIEDAAPHHLEVATGTDGVVPFDRIGRVRLGDLGTLDVWRLTSYGGGMFVPVHDATAGATTYGGGRYLLDTVKGADLGSDDAEPSLVVDLNFAYHPSCAYDPAWACPLAPPGNRLAVAIEAGELLPPGGWT